MDTNKKINIVMIFLILDIILTSTVAGIIAYDWYVKCNPSLEKVIDDAIDESLKTGK